MSEGELLAIDLVAVVLLAFGLYFPRYQRRDMVVAILGINIGVMAVATALANAEDLLERGDPAGARQITEAMEPEDFTGADFRRLYGIEDGSASHYALSYNDFASLAKTYGRMGGLAVTDELNRYS